MNRLAALLILLGIAGLGYGVWLYSRPAAYIVVGAVVIGLGALLLDVAAKPEGDAG